MIVWEQTQFVGQLIPLSAQSAKGASSEMGEEKPTRKKMSYIRGTRWEVIKNYAVGAGLWSAEKNGGREEARRRGCQAHLTFLFMAEFVFRL